MLSLWIGGYMNQNRIKQARKKIKHNNINMLRIFFTPFIARFYPTVFRCITTVGKIILEVHKKRTTICANFANLTK